MSQFFESSGGHEPNANNIDVDHYLRLQVINDQGVEQPIDSRFQYSRLDPYAVDLIFAGERQVKWSFGRNLLLTGIYEPTQTEGDVVVWPTLNDRSEACTAISLFSTVSNETCMLIARTRDVMLFLDQTLDYVPEGHESALYDSVELTVEQFINH